MRIIAGAARGRQLKAPPGLHTRPTTDRVKEAVFSIIQFQVPGARVLDLFAGSGQLGLECLSRGAESCLFCDNDRAALRAVGQNITACGVKDRCTVFAGDFRSAVAGHSPGSFDIILLDPPYGGKILEDALRAIEQFDILAARGIIVCESACGDKVYIPAAPYEKLREYRYGSTAITTLMRSAE